MTDPVLMLAELTPEWVTACLQRHDYKVVVQSVTSRPIGTGQVGATYRLSLDYAGDADGAHGELGVNW